MYFEPSDKWREAAPLKRTDSLIANFITSSVHKPSRSRYLTNIFYQLKTTTNSKVSVGILIALTIMKTFHSVLKNKKLFSVEEDINL